MSPLFISSYQHSQHCWPRSFLNLNHAVIIVTMEMDNWNNNVSWTYSKQSYFNSNYDPNHEPDTLPRVLSHDTVICDILKLMTSDDVLSRTWQTKVMNGWKNAQTGLSVTCTISIIHNSSIPDLNRLLPCVLLYYCLTVCVSWVLTVVS